MKIEIISVEESKTANTVETGVESIKRAIVVSETETTNIEDIFARFLQMEVGDGTASGDTIRNYLSQTKQYLSWCRDNLLVPVEAEPKDIKAFSRDQGKIMPHLPVIHTA
ncbi:MAG: hypothetical protein AAFQ41_11835 [Cyanobacteria bacterium J06623_7]